jgi:hypothetical protein
MSTQRIPCTKCGAMILLATASATGGLCMPCRNAELRPLATHEPSEKSLTVTYSVRPHRGGFSRVYQLTDEGGRIVIRYQNGSRLPRELQFRLQSLHHIYPEHPVTETVISSEDYHRITDHLRGLQLPAVGDATGGFDGTDYALKIDSMMTSIEFRWWVSLPKQWKPHLHPVIKALTHHE